MVVGADITAADERREQLFRFPIATPRECRRIADRSCG
jgi:hypothetical protein